MSYDKPVGIADAGFMALSRRVIPDGKVFMVKECGNLG